MPLRRLYEVPKFTSTVSAYTLSQVKDEAGKFSMQAYSELKEGQLWNNQLTLEMNNALVDIQEAKAGSISQMKLIVITVTTGAFASFFGALMESLFHLGVPGK